MQRSIIAGCKFSVALTRALLLGELTELTKQHKQVDLATYVDDIPITAIGDKAEVRQNLVQAILGFWAFRE